DWSSDVCSSDLSELIYTEVFGPGGPVEQTCSAAYAQIESAIGQTTSNPAVSAAFNNIIKLETGTPAGNNWDNTVANALTEISLYGVTAQEIAVASFVEPILYEAAKGKYNSTQDTILAMTLANAIEKRNLSWAASKSIFEETLRPLLTFFEGFIYAVTPFVGVLVLMGAFGLKLAPKYFLVLIWIQLWMPLLSIVDLYITMGAAREIGQVVAVGNAEPGSIYFNNAVYEAAKSWIGIGSYMATAVPVISFVLVSGSAYAMSGIASGIQNQMGKAADQVADSVQPEIQKLGAINSVSALSSTDAVGTTAS